MRASSLILTLVSLLSACSVSPDRKPSTNHSDSDAPRPNIVVLFLDDAGYGDFGYTGNPLIRTPNIDQIAAEGMRFTQFYAASPACTASRYALLTGRLPVRAGFGWVLTPDSPRGIHPEEWTLAEGLRERGYATAIYGKWHLGRPEQYLPLQHGFDEYLGLPYSNDMRPPKWISLPLIEGNEVVELDPDQTLLTATFTRRAVEFIERHRQEPFFLYVPYSMPHLPLMPGAAFAGGSPRGTYGDVIEELDWSIGEIIGAIETGGLANNTLVFFTSDNGPWIIKNEQGGSAGPFRDGKGSTWEGGMREPGIAWWPGTVPTGSVDREVATTMDIYVTALRLAGGRVPADRTVDGHDISARLRGSSSSEARNPLFYYGAGQKLHAVRQGPWKMHIMTSSQTGIDYFDAKLPLLFHLERDPSERWDVADQFPEVIKQLQGLVSKHLADVAAEGSFFDQG